MFVFRSSVLYVHGRVTQDALTTANSRNTPPFNPGALFRIRDIIRSSKSSQFLPNQVFLPCRIVSKCTGNHYCELPINWQLIASQRHVQEPDGT